MKNGDEIWRRLAESESIDRKLFQDLRRLLSENEAIDEKFFQLEERLLSILNFRDLFTALLTEIEAIFRLPAVWLSLIEECDVVRFVIPLLESEEGLAPRLRRVSRSQFDALLGERSGPVLTDRPTGRFEALFPESLRGQVASLAVVPISLDGEIIGSLNLGDTDPDRYAPEKDTGLLRRLGIKLSLCLSNVTAHERLSFLAYHDALTGLLNRRVMASALEREVDRASRYRHPLSVVFIDVDDFKKVNDACGHECGDALLRHLARILDGCCRTSDVVARFAGDEFVLVLPETNAESARKLMERVCRFAESRPLETPAQPVPVQISFGIADMAEGAPESAESLLQRADQALYRVKRAKKPQTDRQPDRVIDFRDVRTAPRQKERP
jgi:diguanylate cyclase (GGDEF)-like protein